MSATQNCQTDTYKLKKLNMYGVKSIRFQLQSIYRISYFFHFSLFVNNFYKYLPSGVRSVCVRARSNVSIHFPIGWYVIPQMGREKDPSHNGQQEHCEPTKAASQLNQKPIHMITLFDLTWIGCVRVCASERK